MMTAIGVGGGAGGAGTEGSGIAAGGSSRVRSRPLAPAAVVALSCDGAAGIVPPPQPASVAAQIAARIGKADLVRMRRRPASRVPAGNLEKIAGWAQNGLLRR